MTIYIWNYC